MNGLQLALTIRPTRHLSAGLTTQFKVMEGLHPDLMI